MPEEGRCVLCRGQAGFDVVWVPACPGTASGREVTAEKVSRPQSHGLSPPSASLQTGRNICRKSRARWRCGMAREDAGRDSCCPLVAAAAHHPSLRL